MDSEASPGHGTVDDDAVRGTWSVTGAGMTSELCAQRLGVRWWFLLVWFILALASLAIHILGLIDGDRQWFASLASVLYVVVAGVLWWSTQLQRRQQFRADRSEVWMGRGLGQRRYTWSEIRSVTYSVTSADSCLLVVSRRPLTTRASGGNAADRVAAPVARAFLAEARRREIDVDERPAPRPW